MKKKTPLEIPVSARPLQEKILKLLQQLQIFESPLHRDFILIYEKLLTFFAEYQQLVLNNSPYTVACGQGCSNCCNHWVEDVYSFEIEIIADYIRRNKTEDEIKDICAMCREDDAVLQNIQQVIDEKMSNENLEGVSDIDLIDLLLGSFYQMERPCPLLDQAQGNCTIYNVRPITCRIYFNLYHKDLCAPSYINNEDSPTYLLDFAEEASELLDLLHDKFKKTDTTGLRALLYEYLS